MSDSDRHINFQLMRDHILTLQDGEERQTGKKYWRSLDELADSPAFREFVSREYPQQAEEWNDPIERRTFMKLMGASLALAGLSGCVFQPPEKIVPYVKQPEEEVPGKALFFATAAPLFGVATPVLVRSNEVARQRSKAILITLTIGPAIFRRTIQRAIHVARVRQTFSRRPQFSVFTIPTAHKRLLIGKTFGRGRHLSEK
jgi:MoCo/4Fe-4S cofactor protein with predicted Tat translocation signal